MGQVRRLSCRHSSPPTCLAASSTMVTTTGVRAMPAYSSAPLTLWRTVVERTLSDHGRVDVLVNNAGVNIPKDALEVTEADWDGVLDVNGITARQSTY